MRKITFLGYLITSLTSSLWANSCPHLAGRFLCPDQRALGKSEELVITQKRENNIAIYSFTNITRGTSWTRIADGKFNNDKVGETIRTKCIENRLKSLVIEASLQSKIEVTYSIKDSHLVQFVEYPDFKEQIPGKTKTCPRVLSH